MIRRRQILTAALAACAAVRPADAQSADRGTATLLTPHDLGVLGVATLGTVALSAFDVRLAHLYADSGFHAKYPGFHRASKRASVFTETVYMISGGLIYAIAHYSGGGTTEQVALHTTEAVLGGAMSIQVVRGFLGRARPFVDDTTRPQGQYEQYDFQLTRGFTSYDYRAFPSMHAMASFAVASALSQEMRYRDVGARRVLSPLLYTFAALPAVSRMYLNEHWSSDIALGVVIGIVAGQRTVGFSHAHPDNRLDHRLLRAGIMRSNGRTSLVLMPSGS